MRQDQTAVARPWPEGEICAVPGSVAVATPEPPAAPRCSAPRWWQRVLSPAGFGSILLLVGLVYTGWQVRVRDALTAESGLGYALGVVAAAMMLCLGLYPLRKKASFMRRMGAVRHWFLGHIFLGAVGPVMTLFHANFKTGSTNSLFVLTATLVVSTSGFVGMFFYSKLHYGLFGNIATLRNLREKREVSRNNLAFIFDHAPGIHDRLLAFEDAVMAPSQGILRSVVRWFSVGMWTRWTRIILALRVNRAIRQASRLAGWTRAERRELITESRRHVDAHLSLLLKTAELGFYERVFSLWHLLHFPLFLMLVLAGIIHVVAVHMY